jgi:hypothetical protein
VNQDPNEYTVTAAGNVYSRPKSSRPMVGMPDDPSTWRSAAPQLNMPAVDPNDFLAQILAEKTSIAGGFPMSQEEFQHEVTKRMDRGKDVQKVLREQFGVNSIIEGIQKGIFPAPPLRGV